MQYKPSKWVPGYKYGPASSYVQITRMGLFLNVATSKFEPLDSTWDNLHSGGMFVSGTNKIYFRDETNKDIYINSNADNEITIAATSGVTISGGNLIIGTAGKGIDFSAQTSTTASGAAATAELLDHYETGTWTGVISDGTDNATMHGSYTTGTYTKVGNLVTVTGFFLTSSLGSVDGSIRLTGLPYAPANNNRNFGTLSVGYAQGFTITAGENVTAHTTANVTYAVIYLWDGTAGPTAMQHDEWTADGAFIISGSYMTT
jgi:hypothetical protein